MGQPKHYYLKMTEDFLKNNSKLTESLWSELLDYLKHEGEGDATGYITAKVSYLPYHGVNNSDYGKLGIKTGNHIFYVLSAQNLTKIDFSDNWFEYLSGTSENILPSSLYAQYKEKGWDSEIDNPFWNESVNELIKQYLILNGYSEAETVLKEKDGVVYTGDIQGAISTGDGVSYRIADLKNADAGANFLESVYGDVETFTDTNGDIYTLVKNPWVIPWYNLKGYTYAGVRGEDKLVSVLSNPENLQFTQLKKSESPNNYINWSRLLMMKNIRNVEVEDLNRNFWVIGQVTSAISAYLFEPDGALQKILKDLLNEITQLWENVLYLWLSLAALSQTPRYTDIHYEVVYLNNRLVQPYYKYDNFGNESALDDAMNQKTAEERVRAVREWVTDRLSYLPEKYPESNLVIIPVIRRNNYDQDYYSMETYPGILYYNRNAENPLLSWFDAENSYTTLDLADKDYQFSSKMYAIKEDLEVYDEDYELLRDYYDYYFPANAGQLNRTVNNYDGDFFYSYGRSIVNNIKVSVEDNELVLESCNMRMVDVGREVVKGTGRVVWTRAYNKSTNSFFESVIDSDKVKGDISSLNMAEINRGFYPGELLSRRFIYKEHES